MDRARSGSLLVNSLEDLLDGGLEVRLYREDVNGFLFAIRVGSIVKVVLKNRFELLIYSLLKLYRRE
jgi:hypothetical protein